MNRKEALKALTEGHKVVSYFGYEYNLSRHGLEMTPPEGQASAFVPMPEGNEYTYLGSPGNPHEVGTFAWARHEFEKKRRVLAPTGREFDSEYCDWFAALFHARDFTESTWSVVESE